MQKNSSDQSIVAPRAGASIETSKREQQKPPKFSGPGAPRTLSFRGRPASISEIEIASGLIERVADAIARMIEARAGLKQLLGPDYRRTVDPWIKAIREIRKKTGKETIEIFCDLAENEMDIRTRAVLMAATLEAFEP